MDKEKKRRSGLGNGEVYLMLLFKPVVIPSGLDKEHLKKLLKAYEKPDPKDDEDFQTLDDIPEPVFRVKWINPSEFQLTRILYIVTRGFRGYKDVLKVNVEMLGIPQKPDLVARIPSSKLWSYLMKITLAGFLLILFVVFVGYWVKEKDPLFYIIMFSVFGLMWIYAISGFLNDMSQTTTFLRHLVAGDDWNRANKDEFKV